MVLILVSSLGDLRDPVPNLGTGGWRRQRATAIPLSLLEGPSLALLLRRASWSILDPQSMRSESPPVVSSLSPGTQSKNLSRHLSPPGSLPTSSMTNLDYFPHVSLYFVILIS